MDIEMIKETPVSIPSKGVVRCCGIMHRTGEEKARRSNSTPERKSGLTSAWVRVATSLRWQGG